MEKREKKLIVISEQLPPEVKDLVLNFNINPISEKEMKNSQDSDYLFIDPITHPIDAIDLQYQTNQNAISVLQNFATDDPRHFLNHNGKLAVDSAFWTHPLSKNFLQRFFHHDISTSLTETFGKKLQLYQQHFLSSPLQLGHYSDLVATEATIAQREVPNIRLFFHAVAHYFLALEELGIASFPLEMSYGTSNEGFVIQFLGAIGNFKTEHLLDFLSKEQEVPRFNKLLLQAFESTPFLDISLIQEAGKLLISGLWPDQTVRKFLSGSSIIFNQIHTAAQRETLDEREFRLHKGSASEEVLDYRAFRKSFPEIEESLGLLIQNRLENNVSSEYIHHLAQEIQDQVDLGKLNIAAPSDLNDSLLETIGDPEENKKLSTADKKEIWQRIKTPAFMRILDDKLKLFESEKYLDNKKDDFLKLHEDILIKKLQLNPVAREHILIKGHGEGNQDNSRIIITGCTEQIRTEITRVSSLLPTALKDSRTRICSNLKDIKLEGQTHFEHLLHESLPEAIRMFFGKNLEEERFKIETRERPELSLMEQHQVLEKNYQELLNRLKRMDDYNNIGDNELKKELIDLNKENEKLSHLIHGKDMIIQKAKDGLQNATKNKELELKEMQRRIDKLSQLANNKEATIEINKLTQENKQLKKSLETTRQRMSEVSGKLDSLQRESGGISPATKVEANNGGDMQMLQATNRKLEFENKKLESDLKEKDETINNIKLQNESYLTKLHDALEQIKEKENEIKMLANEKGFEVPSETKKGNVELLEQELVSANKQIAELRTRLVENEQKEDGDSKQKKAEENRELYQLKVEVLDRKKQVSEAQTKLQLAEGKITTLAMQLQAAEKKLKQMGGKPGSSSDAGLSAAAKQKIQGLERSVANQAAELKKAHDSATKAKQQVLKLQTELNALKNSGKK